MDSSKSKSKIALWILGGLIAAFLVRGLFVSVGSVNTLEARVRARDAQIDSITKSKDPILEDIEDIRLQLRKKDSLLFISTAKQARLNNTIKQLKNENKRIKDDYLNRSIDERVAFFAKLATEKDSI